jgi:hypothetical protein
VATDKGAELLVTLDLRLESVEAHLLGPLAEDARETFRSQVRLIATRLEALDPLDHPCALAENLDAELPAPRPPARAARRR